MQPLIEVQNLRKTYGSLTAVDDVSFQVFPGEIFGLVGPNGAGKTTTIECIEGLRRPDAGTLTLLSVDPGRQWDSIAPRIGIQLQSSALPARLRVDEALDLFASFYPRRTPNEGLLADLGLAEKRSAPFAMLSGGQKQRLFIALSLVHGPEVVFFDELTTGLDPQARRRIWEMVEHLRDQDKTVVITTHYIEEAEYLCDRVAVMDLGHIIALGTPDELIDEHVSDSIITFRLTPPVDEEVVKGLHGVVSMQGGDGEYRVTTLVPQETLIGIVAMAHEQGVKADDINMKRATLEDVFLKITGRRIRD